MYFSQDDIFLCKNSWDAAYKKYFFSVYISIENKKKQVLQVLSIHWNKNLKSIFWENETKIEIICQIFPP